MSDKGGMIMGIYYSDNITKVYNPSVNKSTSRYITKRRLVNNKQETVIRFIRNRDLNFRNDDSIVHVVNSIDAYRPDLIASKYYGNEKYAWVILSANKLQLPYQLVPGMKILIPSIAALQGAQGKLVTR